MGAVTQRMAFCLTRCARTNNGRKNPRASAGVKTGPGRDDDNLQCHAVSAAREATPSIPPCDGVAPWPQRNPGAAWRNDALDVIALGHLLLARAEPCSKDTALRGIAGLVVRGVFRNTEARGRSTRYELVKLAR